MNSALYLPPEKHIVNAINWNAVDDSKDLEVWNRLTENFWLPEKIPMSNDLKSWATLTPREQLITTRVFVGLTTLDTAQARHGAYVLMNDALTQHEEAVYTNIMFMEAVHAKSYSNIFSTLCSTEEINDAFRWGRDNELLKRKVALVMERYYGDSPLKRKIASVLLESFLFYSGFYLPLYWDTRQKLPNTANMIKLIIRDEAVHGYYIGYKFQQQFAQLSPGEQSEIRDFAYQMLMELYDNEIEYTEEMYDELGLTEDVKRFLHYNGNKALQNIGLDPLYATEICNVSPSIMAALSPEGAVSHDFFSLQGNTYKIAKVETTTDDDWAF